MAIKLRLVTRPQLLRGRQKGVHLFFRQKESDLPLKVKAQSKRILSSYFARLNYKEEYFVWPSAREL